MAKVTLEFDIDAEFEEWNTALRGADYKHVLWELDRMLRGVTKHGGSLIKSGACSEDEAKVCSFLRDQINDMMYERNLKFD